jgi:acetyl esterase/lipase
VRPGGGKRWRRDELLGALGRSAEVGRDCQTYTYRTLPDCELQADVYQSGVGTRPVVVWIHGGALIMGSRRDIEPRQRDMYLDAGFIVVSIDYRLAPETKLPAIADDVQEACRWVRKKGQGLFGADPERLAVVGHSAGGYLTLMAGVAVEPKPRALVSFYGYGDIIGPWYSRPDPFYCRQLMVPESEAHAAVGKGVICGTEEPAQEEQRERFYLYCRQHGLWPKEVGGRDPDLDPEFFYPFCPIRNVTPDYPPTLLLHGDADTDVPYQQSVTMSESLEESGVDHELVTIEGGAHGFDHGMGRDVDEALERVVAFLQSCLT